MSHHDGRRRAAGTFYSLASGVCFGCMAIFARYAYRSGVDVPTLLLLRFATAAAVMWALVLARRTPVPKGRGLAMLLVMGGVMYAGQAFSFFTALTLASAGLVALLLYLYPALVAILSWLVFRHRLTGRQVGAVAAALAGTAFIIGRAGEGRPLGIFFGFLAAVIYSIYILTGARFPADVTPTASTALVTSAAAFTYGCVAAAKGLHLPATPQGWLAVLAIALVCTVMAILFFFEGLARVGPVKASVFSTIEPACTVLLAALFLGEPITLTRILGGGLILGAVVLLALEEGAMTAPPPGDPPGA